MEPTQTPIDQQEQEQEHRVIITPDTVIEVLYVSKDGEFIREPWVAARHGGLPGQIVRPVLSDFLTAKLYRLPVTERAATLKEWIDAGQVEERTYYPNRFFSLKRAGTNLEIIAELLGFGFTSPGRFPEVKFYVTPLEGDKGEQACRLTTDGDEADLQAFAEGLGLKADRLCNADSPLACFTLTPKKREKAIKRGAEETTEERELKRIELLQGLAEYDIERKREMPELLT